MVEQQRFLREEVERERQSRPVGPEETEQPTEKERVPVFEILMSLQAEVGSRVCIVYTVILTPSRAGVILSDYGA